MFRFPEISDYRRRQMLAAALTVLEAQQEMLHKKKNILFYLLERKRRHIRWQHYPKGDRIDRTTGAQYFYHCHREHIACGEHGHFHCFIRYQHLPQSRRPTPLEDWDRYIDNPMTHLVALSLDLNGQPIRLFTVNRWVTSEIWYDAADATHFLKKFKMTKNDDPYWQVLDRWVEGMLVLYAPQIAWLHQERDNTMRRWIKKHRSENPYQDHRLEEISSIPIDLARQIAWLQGE